MTQNHINLDARRLERVLSRWQVIISESRDGTYTAYSNTEPLFCVVRPSLDTLREVVEGVLKSYIETFYHFGETEVKLEESPFEGRDLPIERVRPISRLAPSHRPGQLQPDGPQHALG